jgi:transcriptional regulator with XRE-family HTH domain
MSIIAEERRGHGGPATTPIRRPAAGVDIEPGRLGELRILRGPMTRQELARRIGSLTFDRSLVRAAEAGRHDPDAHLVRRLAAALGISPAALRAGGDGPFVPAALAAARQRQLIADPVTGDLRAMTPEDLADAVAGTWFTRDAVAKIENGYRRPKPDTLAAICLVLECTPAELRPGAQGPFRQSSAQARRRAAEYNAGMREWADTQNPPVSYRDAAGHVRYTVDLREQYARFLAGQDGAVLLAS